MADIEALRGSLTSALPDAELKFKRIFDAWKTGLRPPKLVISRAALLRITLILGKEREVALKVLEQFQFGQKLHEAIASVIKSE